MEDIDDIARDMRSIAVSLDRIEAAMTGTMNRTAYTNPYVPGGLMLKQDGDHLQKDVTYPYVGNSDDNNPSSDVRPSWLGQTGDERIWQDDS